MGIFTWDADRKQEKWLIFGQFQLGRHRIGEALEKEQRRALEVVDQQVKLQQVTLVVLKTVKMKKREE